MSVWRLGAKNFGGAKWRRIFNVLLVLVAWVFVPHASFSLETAAKQAVLLDYETGLHLYSKNADELMSPASMTKMMTVYLIFERLKEGRLSLEDQFLVSRKAWRKGGSKMFVEAGERVSVEDLIRGIVVQSGNDATIVVAEGLSGSEEAFAREMTEKARDLGMSNTTFKNASGWPDPDHRTSAGDLAILAGATIKNFPEMYHYYAEREFTFSQIKQQNRNPLLGRLRGADGLKTGYTENAGYGLTASAMRDGRRLIIVLNGLPSERARKVESQRMMDWGFREFGNYKLFEANEKIESASVWLGKTARVPMLAKEGVLLTLERKYRRDLKVKIRYEAPISAPIKKGAVLGDIFVEVANRSPITVQLIAGKDVARLGPGGRLTAALGHLLWGASK
ncbi:MAG: D-alanyl-D-alanine carboxypeptidase DacA [Alphaproteobacteria bacterium MarineAlpha4_Bin2]|mgnify:CR=1 FL=1|nr:MAG: D-alanyl-D-alanine carboxypeptidase DacA [Alphaproteobacteria bacterium MarineAlpha4_Bin2]